jgi:hypothetical protein
MIGWFSEQAKKKAKKKKKAEEPKPVKAPISSSAE